MVIYWRFQFLIDALLMVLVTIVLIVEIALTPQIILVESKIVDACRFWVAPILTLLGLVCATTAFLFTAIERSEFDLLRGLEVEGQLWAIFSEVIFWLSVAAISSAAISFADADNLPRFISGYALYLFLMVSLCLLKFAWVMRHIIAVRMRR